MGTLNGRRQACHLQELFYLFYLLCIAYLHLPSIQPQRRLRITTLTLGRLMLADMELTRTPTATWSRRLYSRINASRILKQRVGLKMRKTVHQWNSTTAQVSSKQTSNVFALMSMNWYATLLKQFTTRLWKKLIKSRGVSLALAKIEFAIQLTKSI